MTTNTTKKSEKPNPYKERGFENRSEYLKDLFQEHDVEAYVGFAVADMLGPNEDFDGLINSLEDIEQGFM